MPQVYLLVGLTGSGRRGYCRRVLEPAGVVCLPMDEPGAAVLGRVTREVRSGHDVALRPGLWRRADRDAWKRRVEVLDATWRLLYFPASRAALLHRLGVAASDVDDMYTRFEEPVDEGEEVIQPGSY